MSAPTTTTNTMNAAFAKLVRRNTKAADAIAAEDDRTNPWTAVPRPRTDRYFAIREWARELPAAATRGEFLELYHKEQVIILTGDTGSGKTTQIPQYIMYTDLPQRTGKRIVCTQPRRIAAREVAKRVASELDVNPGEEVGYAFRHENVTGQMTQLVYTTDGRLLQEVASDPLLNKYSCIIIDEAHERTESTDLLLGFIKPILRRRPDLKLVVMSATMRTETFRNYFGKAPIFKIPGRTFPVSVLYLSDGQGGNTGQLTQMDYVSAAVRTVLHIHKKYMPGDILVFVPGEEDIDKAVIGIKHEVHPAGISVSALYGNMPKAAQEAALGPDAQGRRRCIVATNIAETSLTIDGIVHVIDTGLEKGMTYNPRLRLWTLQVEPISQASANQRAGRAGRTQEGKCWRIYSKFAYDNILIKDPLPGLLRGNMAGPILDILAVGRAADASSFWGFPFLDRPAPEIMLQSWHDLQHLGCIDERGQITPFGKRARGLPLEPRHAAAILRALEMDPYPVWEVTAIVCLLNEEHIFVRPGALPEYADLIREKISCAAGDHFTLLNVWHAFQYQLNVCCKGMKSEDRARHLDRWCQENYLNIASLQGAMMTFDSIIRWIGQEFKFKVQPAPAAAAWSSHYIEVIKKVLLRAFFTNIAVKDPKDMSGQSYRTLEENQCAVAHPASAISRGHKYEFVFYDKFVDQTKEYFMDVTGIDSKWLFEDRVVSAFVKKLLDQPPQSSDKWASLTRLRMAQAKFQRHRDEGGVAGGAEASRS